MSMQGMQTFAFFIKAKTNKTEALRRKTVSPIKTGCIALYYACRTA